MSENNGFFSRFRLGNILGYDRRTDEYTQPVNTNPDGYGYAFYEMQVDAKHDQWVTIENNEFRLYNTTPELQTILNRGASLFANGVWRVKEYGTGKIVENHPLYKLLEAPNVYQNRNEFLSSIYLNRALYGNNFTYMNYATSISDLPTTITNLLPKMVKLERSGNYVKQVNLNDVIKYYKLVDGEGKVLERFKPDEIIHLKIYNPNDPLYGLSPLNSLHMPLSNIRSARGYINADYTKKGAHGILAAESVKDGAGQLPYEEEDRIALEKQYSQMTHGSSDGQSTVVISPKPVKWLSISSAIKDHLILEVMSTEYKALIDAFGLNESLFGFEKQSTFSNQENGERQAYQNHIIPLSETLSYALTDKMDLINKFGVYVELDYSHVDCMRENAKESAETLKVKTESLEKLLASGIALEEARLIVGL